MYTSNTRTKIVISKGKEIEKIYKMWKLKRVTSIKIILTTPNNNNNQSKLVWISKTKLLSTVETWQVLMWTFLTRFDSIVIIQNEKEELLRI